jgi:hypothetical protein
MLSWEQPKFMNQLQTQSLKLSLYETDFHAWLQAQILLLSKGKWQEVDVKNLIEELEDLGRQQRQELRNRLSILIGHLLKWEYQSNMRSRSWLSTIKIQRRDTIRLLKDNPSLKSYLAECILESYDNGRDLAIGETNLPAKTFPNICPYDLIQILDEQFFPGIPSDLLDE